MNKYIFFAFMFVFGGCASSTRLSNEFITLQTQPADAGTELFIEFLKGPAFNHPSFAIWTEDLEGNYIETLYVTKFVASGKFGHSEIEPGKWSAEPGTVRRKATLPYWAHKRNIKAPDGLYVPSPETTVPDALSGATPLNNFKLNTATKVQKRKFRVLLEINQAWDSNEFWTNSKLSGNMDYFTSLQPSLIYAVTIDPTSDEKNYYLNAVGHGEPSGQNGKLFTDLTTLTTAKEIAEKIIVHINK